MSNPNQPFGFRPVGHLFLDRIPGPRPYVLTAGQVIYLHDPVIVTNAGTVSISAAGQTTTHLGICAGYVNDGGSVGGKEILVYDDPNIIYAVQVKTTVTVSQTHIFNSADHITYATGHTTSPYESIMALDTPGTSSKPWKILGLYKYPNNAFGDSAIVEVIYNQHYMFAANAGV